MRDESSSSNGTPIESVLPVDNLVKGTLSRLKVATIEELAALEVAVVANRKGVGTRKLTVLEKLILKARAFVHSVSAQDHMVPRNSGVSDHLNADLLFVPSMPMAALQIESVLPVDSLVKPTLCRLNVSTIEDLAALEIAVVANRKGIGIKKLAALETLILKARDFVQSVSAQDHLAPQKNGLGDNLDADLLFVPSLLKPTFQRDGVKTIAALLTLQPRELETHLGWGERKIGLLVTMQQLYRDLAACRGRINDFHIVSLVAPNLLPAALMRKMTVEEFVNATAESLNLDGHHKADFYGLRQLLRAHIDGAHSTHTRKLAYLWQFEKAEMDWRDVPLDLSKRVVDFLDRFNLVSLKQLDHLASAAHVFSPESGKLISALEQKKFGDTCLESLQSELEKLNRLGLIGYRRGVICGLEDLPDVDLDWREIPLRISKRLRTFLAAFRVMTVRDLHALAVRKQVRCPESGNVFSALDQEGFSENLLIELRKELCLLAKLGLDGYRYGESGKPQTVSALAEAVFKNLRARDAEVFRLRLERLTLEEISAQLGLTGERVRQLEKRAQNSSRRYRFAALALLRPVDDKLQVSPGIELAECTKLVGANEAWQFWLTVAIAGREYDLLDSGWVSRFSRRQIDALDSLVRNTMRNGRFQANEGRVWLRTLVTSAPDQTAWFVKELRPLVAERDKSMTTAQLLTLTGGGWLKKHVRSQLVDADVNGLFFDEIETFGGANSAEELAGILGTDVDVLSDGRFRRPGELYRKADEIVEIIRQAKAPITALSIMRSSRRHWYQPQLARYLAALYEIVSTDRGAYVHIDKLSLTVRDVVRIAAWGAELLAGERKLIDGEELFDLYRHADLGLPLENAFQIVSIVAKHPDVRRVANNLQLAHRGSFDEAELFLAVTDPDLAAQWDWEKNGAETPETVRPTAARLYWWKCELGHEFQASPVYRTRATRNCPGCLEKWTITKIRHFVRSLQKALGCIHACRTLRDLPAKRPFAIRRQGKGIREGIGNGQIPEKGIGQVCFWQEFVGRPILGRPRI